MQNIEDLGREYGIAIQNLVRTYKEVHMSHLVVSHDQF